MNKTIATACVGLILAAAASPAFARVRHHRQADPAPAAESRINSAWGPPRSWDEIEISHPEGGG